MYCLCRTYEEIYTKLNVVLRSGHFLRHRLYFLQVQLQLDIMKIFVQWDFCLVSVMLDSFRLGATQRNNVHRNNVSSQCFAQRLRVVAAEARWSGNDSLSSPWYPTRFTFPVPDQIFRAQSSGDKPTNWAVNLKHSSTTNDPIGLLAIKCQPLHSQQCYVIPSSMLTYMLNLLHLLKLICKPQSFWSIADVKGRHWQPC